MFSSTSVLAGLALLGATATFATQGASEPVKSPPEYFVTAEGDAAHLWVREGNALRVVGHGECKNCPMHKEHADHAEGDDHDHAKKK